MVLIKRRVYTYKVLVILALLCLSLVIGAVFLYHQPNKSIGAPNIDTSALPSYTKTTLAQYNGAAADLPIYVALDGYVYDVTAGREFYAPGGTYHFIAGKDASQELHVFGGDIVREKYSIVGTFIDE